MEDFFLETVALDDENDQVIILDQTLLPLREEYVRLTTAEQIWVAINNLQVRGAPAIGIAAAMGIYVCVKREAKKNCADLNNFFYETKNYLASSRPTAVNLFWALDEMEKAFNSGNEKIEALREAAVKIKNDDIAVCKAIGTHGAALLKNNMGILTHCNAGSLATARYGTALAPIYAAAEQGVKGIRVYADETRPLLQGARLTAYELHRAGLDVTLICDNMASAVMQQGWVQAVFVGCDRVAANGDTANKIGTSGVAILAAAYGIPFYVCAPRSTIDFSCSSGSDITIEERSPSEVTHKWYAHPMAPEGVKVYNPAFDVTPQKYITAFITERGVIFPPFEKKIHQLK
ncbi:MAG: S-methyl-5-thioribose-1-phosphate isomerase [Defluviitaleaceae bacterium]|nr:S-methyl-5-thioribose-1-phosphate isomerase [Defluviitaleaceae bacterium]